MTQNNLVAILELMKRIEAIKVPNENGVIGTFTDLCNKPVPGKGCMVQSVLEFWQEDLKKLQVSFNLIYYFNFQLFLQGMTPKEFQDHLETCLKTTTDGECLSSIGIFMSQDVFPPFLPFVVVYIFTIILGDIRRLQWHRLCEFHCNHCHLSAE